MNKIQLGIDPYGRCIYRLISVDGVPRCDWQYGPHDKEGVIQQSKDRFGHDKEVVE